MGKPFTAMHISDLHRSSLDPISNDELISALVGDRDRYIQEDPKIPSPDALIISGDIIQGVPLGTANYEDELAKQYAAAERLLDELTRRFVDGDRSKVIIVPGNHDVDWNTAFSSMEEVDPRSIPDFGRRLRTEHSDYKWDWKTCKAYRVVNKARYAQRLDVFWNFFERFYKGVPGLLRVQPRSDANLFDLYEGRIGVAAFNSCEGNDCFADHGMIRGDVIARSHLDLRDLGEFELLMAVWHHSIEGRPYQSDYIDIRTVHEMIGRGFRIGLYGHQHKSQVVPFHIALPDMERMVVASAGSLCAGRYDLPTGTARQYNILEFAADLRSVKVHVREMVVAKLFSKGRLIELGGGSFTELAWEPPKNPVGLPDDMMLKRSRSIITMAEQAYKDNDFSEVSRLLKRMNLMRGSYERNLCLEAYQQMQNWQGLIELTMPPASIDELYQRVDAFTRLGDFEAARQSLDIYSATLNFPDPLKAELIKRINILTNIHL